MAISYLLELVTPSSPAEVARELHALGRAEGLFDESVSPERLAEGAVSVSGSWLRVFGTSKPSWHVLVTDLGINPTVSVIFQPDKERDIAAAQHEMVRLVSGLLARVGGDAVLHRDLDQVWLLRRDGELSLSERTDIWPPERLAAVSQPYHRRTVVFSE
ncbi:SitI3 family protein [Crossiella sp. SN42]|uniref:SitI3 family protein n=1 Tax=Crossiella sp. SN42 TaxID=2944808 RepID=UPI00207C704F|nr:SitI3 family protein [Crossiella sp. SN42]MCO1581191.1 SitI3 family protein [Crossiella sp. SN42]